MIIERKRTEERPNVTPCICVQKKYVHYLFQESLLEFYKSAEAVQFSVIVGYYTFTAKLKIKLYKS